MEQESREAEQMVEWSWDESQTEGGIAVAVRKKWKRADTNLQSNRQHRSWADEQRHEENPVPWGDRDTVMRERKFLERETQDG